MVELSAEARNGEIAKRFDFDLTYLLEERNVGKRFPGVVALDGVNLGVRGGSVHAVVGENGAGKLTLMKILSGVYRADAGSPMSSRRCATEN